MGTVYPGRMVGTGAAVDGPLGTVGSGRVASEANLALARRFFLEARADDFEWLSEREVVDRGSGAVLELVLADPLLGGDPASMADVFFAAANGEIAFLRSTGTTVADRERAAAAQADQVARIEAERAKRLGRERQVGIPLSVVYGERLQLTLRQAAARIVDAGGEIRRGALGELQITVPEKLGDEMLVERARWVEVGVAADVLARAPRVVLQAIADVEADGSRRPRSLVERLPDAEVGFGGGIAV
jgi:hypothetical protein